MLQPWNQVCTLKTCPHFTKMSSLSNSSRSSWSEEVKSKRAQNNTHGIQNPHRTYNNHYNRCLFATFQNKMTCFTWEQTHTKKNMTQIKAELFMQKCPIKITFWWIFTGLICKSQGSKAAEEYGVQHLHLLPASEMHPMWVWILLIHP